MAHYTNTQIFKDTYNMVFLLTKSINRINRSYKYMIGDECKKSSMRMLILLNIINTSGDFSERVKYLNEFLIHYETVKLCMKMCIDFHLLSAKEFSKVYPLTKTVREQALKLKKYYTNMQTFKK